MDTTVSAVIVAAVTLGFNVFLHLFGGGWKLSNKLAAIEAGMNAMQEEIKKLGDVLIKMADMRGEIRVIDTRLTSAEQDIRELRHGEGFVRGRSGVDREYP